MAKFLNKKEQVYDLKLTSYGRYLLGEGSFKPTYYAFFDDSILYDSDYARSCGGCTGSVSGLVSGSKEAQNNIHKRIKEETQYLESLVLFEDVDNNRLLDTQTYNETEGYFESEFNPTKAELRKDNYVYEAMIGDAHFNGETQAAPAWKIVTLQGEISSINVDPVTTRIPQVNITALYTKDILDDITSNLINPSGYEDSDALSYNTFADNKAVYLQQEHPVFYIEELNTELFNENFDIEIFEFVDNPASIASGSIDLTGSIPFNGDTVTIGDGINTLTFEFTSSVHGTSSYAVGTTSPMFTPLGIAYPIAANGNTLVERGCVAYGYGSVGTNAQPCRDDGSRDDTNSIYLSKARGLLFQAITASILNMEVAYGSIRWIGPGQIPEDVTPSLTKIELYNKRPGVGGNQLLSASNGSGSGDIENWNGKIQLMGMSGGVDGTDNLSRKYFEEEESQIQDGYMISKFPIVHSRQTLTTASVDYYFDFLTDAAVDQKLACKGAEIFNKQSYYIDLDFDCETKEENTTYYDIYGYVTEPEICQDQY